MWQLFGIVQIERIKKIFFRFYRFIKRVLMHYNPLWSTFIFSHYSCILLDELRVDFNLCWLSREGYFSFFSPWYVSRLKRKKNEADFWFMNRNKTQHISLFISTGEQAKAKKKYLFYAFFFWGYKLLRAKCYCFDIKQLLMNLCGSVGTLTVASSFHSTVFNFPS